MTDAREIGQDWRYCPTPGQHPDHCNCPIDGRHIETVPGIDHWNDQEQQA